MTRKPIDTNKYGENDKLSKDELSSITTAVFQCFLSSCNYKETSRKYHQAYVQIVALIKKEVTEERINDSIKEASVEIYNLGYYLSFKPKEISAIIYKLVKEIKNG